MIPLLAKAKYISQRGILCYTNSVKFPNPAKTIPVKACTRPSSLPAGKIASSKNHRRSHSKYPHLTASNSLKIFSEREWRFFVCSTFNLLGESTINTQAPKYLPSVGQKFNPDGSTKEFPGNTVICHVPQDSATFALLLRVRQEAETQPWAKKYSFLPPSSYHMTVFDGVCDQVRVPENWTSKLPLDAPLEQVDEFLRTAWQNLPKPAGFTVQYRSFYGHDYIGMNIQPTTPEVEREIRGFRDQLSTALGIRHPNHAEYAFHITLAYGIEVLTPTEGAQVTAFEARMHHDLQENFGILHLNTPELTFFADMACFAPVRPQFT